MRYKVNGSAEMTDTPMVRAVASPPESMVRDSSATGVSAAMPRANTAVAHKLARMVYFMLPRGEDYVDQGQQHYEEQQCQCSIAALRRRAADLGFAIAPKAATA